MSLLKRDTSHCPSWREQVIKNEDGIMEKYDWITPVQGDKTKVICSLCSASRPFSVANGGITSCKQHARGMTHKKVVKERSPGKIQTRLFDGATGPDMLTRAEALRALHLVVTILLRLLVEMISFIERCSQMTQLLKSTRWGKQR